MFGVIRTSMGIRSFRLVITCTVAVFISLTCWDVSPKAPKCTVSEPDSSTCKSVARFLEINDLWAPSSNTIFASVLTLPEQT